ncbi:unnamed protein product [Amoebophrya sp. A120]|nr:unnamed protein product [Amoebophrya sp. A120]|eukprot:GSA120T00020249001.1
MGGGKAVETPSPKSLGSPRQKFPTAFWELHPFDAKADKHSMPLEVGMMKSKSFKDLKRPSHGEKSVERPVQRSSPKSSPRNKHSQEAQLITNMSICSLTNWYKEHPQQSASRKKPMPSSVKK